jgi:hypothetical protein
MDKKLFAITLTVLLSAPAVLVPQKTAAVDDQSFMPTQMRPQLEYRVGLSPSQIWDGTIEYFKERGFTSVVLVAATTDSYEKELQKIKQTGMYPILDVEYIIWNGGEQKSTSINNFTAAFATWKRVGWTHVATEGGRNNDLDVLKDYFTKFTFFNCDRCGIYKGFNKHPYTTDMSWETFYASQIGSIKRGAVESYNLGKGQGLLAGVWEANNDCRNDDTYKNLLDWSYSKNAGFTHFHVFFGLGYKLADYKRLGFESIVSELQRYYPPKPAPSQPPSLYITSVREEPAYPNRLVWDITNTGTESIWVAPYAILYNETTSLPGYAWGEAIVGQNASSSAEAAVSQNGGLGWVRLEANSSVTIVSPATVSVDKKWAVYNAYTDNDTSIQGRLYSSSPYTTVGYAKVEANLFEVIFNSIVNILFPLALALVLASVALTALLLLLRRIR